MRTRNRGLIVTLSAFLAFSLLLAACGGSDDGEPSATTSGSSETTSGSTESTSDSTQTTSGSTEATAAPAAGGTVTIGSILDNNTFDRAGLEIGHRIQYWMPVYDTLLVLDENAEVQPNVATEWDYNDDLTALTLTLREGLTFTDGAPVDAAAVQANLEYLAAGTGQNSFMAASIEEYEIVSPTEIVLHLSAPDPGLLSYLGIVGGALASPASLTNDDVSATTPVGSGPYILDAASTTQGQQYTYVRNPDYWNPQAYAFDTVVIKPLQDATARLNALISGQVDLANLEPANAIEAERNGMVIERHALDWRGLIIADREGTVVPALADVRVRQALNYVFDKESILENLQLGEGEVTSQTFNTASPAFVPELDAAYSYNLDQAKALMADAGYADGFEVTMPDFAALPAMAPIIEQQLGQINITVNFETVAPDATISDLLAGKFPMFFFVLGSQSPWQDVNKWAFPESPWNTSHVTDTEMLALLDTAQNTLGDEQKTAFQAINTYVVENAWFAPWFRSNTLNVHSPDLAVTIQPWNAAVWISGLAPAS